MSAKANGISKRTKSRERGRGSKLRMGVSFVGGGLLLILLFVYLLTALFYKSHFYDNTMINGVSTANMTASEAEAAVTKEVKSYQLTLEERNGLSDTISGKDINLHTEIGGEVNNLLDKQNAFSWPVSLFQSNKYDVKTMFQYDEALLKNSFQNLKCFQKANIKEPTNASISEYGENGFEIVPENPGAKVIENKLYEAVVQAINNMETSLSVDKAGCYEVPKLNSKAPELQIVLKKLNKLTSAKITYEFGDKTEVVDGSRISKWITIDDKDNVKLNKDGVKEFVDYIGKTYNSFGRVRTFKTSYGDTIQVKGGDYGWWLNRPKEVEELTKLIKKGEVGMREPAYFQTAQQFGDDDIGDTYVEVNLTAQHLFFYHKGKKILETDFVSGNVSKKLGTPVGTYPVQYAEKDATLVGEDYSTPVKYWMPFNKNIGLHDAPWRDEFGKNIYLTRGSHGCINMPPAMAKKMFKYMQRGVAVVVYELPGTENYDTGKETTKDTKKIKAAATKKDKVKDTKKLNTDKQTGQN